MERTKALNQRERVLEDREHALALREAAVGLQERSLGQLTASLRSKLTLCSPQKGAVLPSRGEDVTKDVPAQ